MEDQSKGRSFYRDDESTIDRDGLPHYIGERPERLKEYTKRVSLMLSRIEGTGEETAAT